MSLPSPELILAIFVAFSLPLILLPASPLPDAPLGVFLLAFLSILMFLSFSYSEKVLARGFPQDAHRALVPLLGMILSSTFLYLSLATTALFIPYPARIVAFLSIYALVFWEYRYVRRREDEIKGEAH